MSVRMWTFNHINWTECKCAKSVTPKPKLQHFSSGQLFFFLHVIFHSRSLPDHFQHTHAKRNVENKIAPMDLVCFHFVLCMCVFFVWFWLSWFGFSTKFFHANKHLLFCRLMMNDTDMKWRILDNLQLPNLRFILPLLVSIYHRRATQYQFVCNSYNFFGLMLLFFNLQLLLFLFFGVGFFINWQLLFASYALHTNKYSCTCSKWTLGFRKGSSILV